VASDGETYGHHHRSGHQALTRSISDVEKSGQAKMTNYGMFLSLAPPVWEVKLVEPSSWSCAHGVERWRSDCGCGSEIRPGYNQKWRTPLRASLDWLRDRGAQVYSKKGETLFRDKDETRERLASVGVKTPAGSQKYLAAHLRGGLSSKDAAHAAMLLELVECTALMYASCAWFWEDISRQETRQMLRYAARAIEIIEDVTGDDLGPEFAELLGRAVPNAPGFEPGPGLFSKLVGGYAQR